MESNGLSYQEIDNVESTGYSFTSVRDFLQNKREFLPKILLAIAVLSGALTVVKATGLFIASAKAERIVKRAVAWSETDPNDVKSQVAKSKLIADDLKEKNLFWPSPKEHPVKTVMGIFGDEAYINGRWYKVGAKVGDAKILAIEADSVTTEWDGKKKVFRPIDAGGSPAPGGSRPGPVRPGPRPIKR